MSIGRYSSLFIKIVSFSISKKKIIKFDASFKISEKVKLKLLRLYILPIYLEVNMVR